MKSFYLDPVKEQHLPKLDISGGRACLSAMIPESDIRVPAQCQRPAIIVLGGGGYDHMSLREGEPIALQFVAAGAVGFTLYYSQIPKRYPAQLLDVAYSVAYVRKHAADMHVNPKQIFLCGMSAGGHPAAALAIYSTGGHCSCQLPDGCAPSGLILGYPLLDTGIYGNYAATENLLGVEKQNPILLKETSLIDQVHGKMSPTFLWHTVTDESIPAMGTLRFAQKLLSCGVPCELHLYPKGKHGLSLAQTTTAPSEDLIEPACAEWISAAVRWMRERAAEIL